MPKRDHDTRLLVCLKTADLVKPHAPSFEAECDSCRTPVWVAKSSPKTARKICLPCAAPHMLDRNAKIGALTQKQIDDVVRHRRWFR